MPVLGAAVGVIADPLPLLVGAQAAQNSRSATSKARQDLIRMQAYSFVQ
jgi:hypothetical protein